MSPLVEGGTNTQPETCLGICWVCAAESRSPLHLGPSGWEEFGSPGKDCTARGEHEQRAEKTEGELGNRRAA